MNEENATPAERTDTPERVTQAVSEVLHEKYDEDMRARATRARRERLRQGASILAGVVGAAVLLRTIRYVIGTPTYVMEGSEAHGVVTRFMADFDEQLVGQRRTLIRLNSDLDELTRRKRSSPNLLLLVGAALLAWRLNAERAGQSSARQPESPEAVRASGPT